jgi:2-oxoglutarate ferredoxin oxidoreductase subunit delta
MKLWRTPLDADLIQRPKGTISIITERCKGCSFCIDYCPKDALVMSENFNKKGYHYPNIVKVGLCVNCELCSNICPEFAIFSEEDNQTISTKMKEELTHEKI